MSDRRCFPFHLKRHRGRVVPFLRALAHSRLPFNDRFRCVMETHAAGGGAVGTTVDAAHGGYFNGGLGIMLLALFSLWECATSTR